MEPIAPAKSPLPMMPPMAPRNPPLIPPFANVRNDRIWVGMGLIPHAWSIFSTSQMTARTMAGISFFGSLNAAFIETIAGQWKRLGIETASEAMDIAFKESKKYL